MLTDDEIAAIRSRVSAFHRSHDEACFHMKMDARMLLAEVERLREPESIAKDAAVSAALADALQLREAMVALIALADEPMICPGCKRNWTQLEHHASDCPVTRARNAILGQ